MRFRRANHVRKSSDFQRCRLNGQRYQSLHFILWHLRRQTGECRLGVVVSRKTGGAVTRNRWKRVMRETFRGVAEKMSPSADHVVVVKRRAQGKPPREIRKELENLLMRVAVG